MYIGIKNKWISKRNLGTGIRIKRNLGTGIRIKRNLGTGIRIKRNLGTGIRIKRNLGTGIRIKMKKKAMVIVKRCLVVFQQIVFLKKKLIKVQNLTILYTVSHALLN